MEDLHLRHNILYSLEVVTFLQRRVLQLFLQGIQCRHIHIADCTEMQMINVVPPSSLRSSVGVVIICFNSITTSSYGSSIVEVCVVLCVFIATDEAVAVDALFQALNSLKIICRRNTFTITTTSHNHSFSREDATGTGCAA